MDLIAFNGEKYLAREATLSDGQIVLVAEEKLDSDLLNCGFYVSDEARRVDEEIYCYVDRNKLLDMKQDDFDKYVIKEFT